MSESRDNLSALFRSLEPDDTNFQATTNAFAQEAEERWPLFKAVSPKIPEPTPALSAQERQRWSNLEKPEVGVHKPALSLPEFSEKLEMSLSKISEQPTAKAAQPVTRISKESPPSESSHNQRDFSQQTTSNTRNPLFSRSTAVVRSSEAEGVFPQILAEATATKNDLSGAAHADTSLTSVFSRIQGKEKATSNSVERLSSFFGRLGNR